MAERPRILRSLRALDAAALAVAAAHARDRARPGRRQRLRRRLRGRQRRRTAARPAPPRRPGRDPRPRGHAGAAGQPPGDRRRAVGVRRSARRSRSRAARRSPRPAPTRVAVSATWVAWRTAGALHAAPLYETPVPRQIVAGNVGRPVLSRQPAGVRDRRADRGHRPQHRRARCCAARRARELRGPSVEGYRLTYIKATYKRQQVLTGVLLPRRTSSRPHALRHHAHGQPRRGPRARPRPRPRPHQQAAVAAAARGRLGHADDDGHERRAPSTSPASASRAAAPRAPTWSASTSDCTAASAWVGARSMIRWLRGGRGRRGGGAGRARGGRPGEDADRGGLARSGGERRPAGHAGRDRRHAPDGGNAFDAAIAAAARARRGRAVQLRHRRRRLHGLPRRRDGQDLDARLAREVARRDGAELVLHRRQAADRRPVQRQPLQRPLSAGVPGTPYAWSYILRKYGTLQAERGAEPTASRSPARASRSTRRSSTRRRPTSPYFDDIPSTAALYLDADGTPKDIGTVIKNPDLASTYERMGRLGVTKGFYTGPVADAMVKAATQPPVGADRRPHVAARPADQPRPRALPGQGRARPVKLSYFGHDIYGMGPPSSGATTIAETLNIMQDFSRRGVAFKGRTGHGLQLPRGVAAGLRRPQPLHRRPVVRAQPGRGPALGRVRRHARRADRPDRAHRHRRPRHPARRAAPPATAASIERVGSTTHLSVADKRRQHRLLHVHDRVHRRQRHRRPRLRLPAQQRADRLRHQLGDRAEPARRQQAPALLDGADDRDARTTSRG